MFTFLVSASLRNRLFVLAMAAILVLLGAYTARQLPVDVFPDLNRPTVTIMTEAEGQPGTIGFGHRAFDRLRGV